MCISRQLRYVYLAVIAFAVVLTGCASSLNYANFPSAALGSPQSVRAFEYKPDGEGPFPAVVVMHTGGGIFKSHHDWAKLLKNWGYVAFLVDTYGAREYSNVKQIGNIRESADQLSDAYGAFNYLSELPYVDADRIGIIGFSRGGLTVINVMEEPGHFQSIMHLSLQKRGLFRAGVAMYPVCRNHFETTLKGPLLILIGKRDTAIWGCERIAENTNPDGHPARIKIYPGAIHSFDTRRAFDRNAAKDSKKQINQFFKNHLGNSL